MAAHFWLKMLVTLVAVSTATTAKGLGPATQNRGHLGAAWTPGGSQGVLGFDSRLTQSILVDVGGFYSPNAAKSSENQGPWVLRHGLYVTPGFRIPHRNKSEIKTDVIIRAGFGPVWVASSEFRFDEQINPGLHGGADLMFRYKEWGLRFEGRMWYVKPFNIAKKMEEPTMIPQMGSSVLYQF
jgi:hypothetical protein